MTKEKLLLKELIGEEFKCTPRDISWDILASYRTVYEPGSIDDDQLRIRLAALCSDTDDLRTLVYARMELDSDKEMEYFRNTCWGNGYQQGDDFREHVRRQLYEVIHPQRYRTEIETASIAALILKSLDSDKARGIANALPINNEARYFKELLLAELGSEVDHAVC